MTVATNTAGVGINTLLGKIVESMGQSWLLMVAYVDTVKAPESLTESGFVPPELNLNVKAAPPLANVPLLPNGLVRVRRLPTTLHPVGDKFEDASDREQAAVASIDMDEGNNTVILEADGIA